MAANQNPPRRITAALVDLNGTLIDANGAPFSGAINALQRLRAAVSVLIVTNTSKQTIESILDSIRQLVPDIRREEVFSSLTATRKLLEDRCLRPFLLLHPDVLPDFEGLLTGGDPNCVVVGLAKEAFSWRNMNQAFRILQYRDSQLIAIHKGCHFKEPDGLSLGPGPFVLALEHASGKTAQVVGKPQAAFFQQALGTLGCSPGDAVMIGDDVRDDVGGAQAVGCRGLLVQTGKYQEGDETEMGVQPTATLPNFAAAVTWILQQNAAAR